MGSGSAEIPGAAAEFNCPASRGKEKEEGRPQKRGEKRREAPAALLGASRPGGLRPAAAGGGAGGGGVAAALP